uniref:TNFR-Cys domain-containing protein n=1 Tax=Mola mola TaxID=94237 RepID=A0A3Q3WZI4_MOLML
TAKMSCINEDQYTSKDGRCCDRCQAGQSTLLSATECAQCNHGLYTATKNHMRKCNICTVCSPSKTLKDCTAQVDAVCTCVSGFYCSNNRCDHCRPASRCSRGEGVKALATHTNDTICAPCEDGTYSNVTDFHSPCRAHTRCEDIGRELKTLGTRTTDAICGNFKSHCHWALPASLWSGLVLTALILFGLIYWREKRRSRRTGLNVEFISSSDHDMVNDNTQGSLDSCLPITPLKASVSFAESSHGNGSTGYSTGNFLRSYSEPQEDEWCGT